MSAVVPTSEVPIKMADLSPEYAEIMVLGNVLQKSGYFKDVRDQAQAVTKILFGRELGISPINSMSAIHIIEGKPALSSNLLAALIKRSGRYDYRVKVWNDEVCILTFRQKIGETWEEVGESSFTMEDAKRARVVKDGSGWMKYPKAMLFARALSQGERTYCPDVSVCALYVPEELGAEVNEQNEVVGHVPSQPGEVARITEAIPISGPAKAAVAATTVKGAAPQTAVSEPQEVAVSGETAAASRREPNSDGDECIDLPRQRALHREFRDAIRNDGARKQADTFLRDWLKHQGFIDDEGKGTTKTIPMLLFEEVKAKAVAFAGAMPK